MDKRLLEIKTLCAVGDYAITTDDIDFLLTQASELVDVKTRRDQYRSDAESLNRRIDIWYNRLQESKQELAAIHSGDSVVVDRKIIADAITALCGRPFYTCKSGNLRCHKCEMVKEAADKLRKALTESTVSAGSADEKGE